MNNSDTIATESWLWEARKQVEEAVEVMQFPDKEAYLKALETAPHLFDSTAESDPVKFFRVCDHDPWKAAKRLCFYWKERLSVFGPERAFLPLTLTGDGALTKEDIMTIKAGFPCLLAKNKTGQQVVYFDRRRWIATTTTEVKLRVTFYIASFMSQEERVQTEGCLVLNYFVSPSVPGIPMDWVYFKRGVALALGGFQIKIAQFHLLNEPPKRQFKSNAETKRKIIQDLLHDYVAVFLEKGFDSAGITVHFGREEGELLRELQDDIGLDISSIPRSLGGTWDFIEAIRWCRKQALDERTKFKGLLLCWGGGSSAGASTPARTKGDNEEDSIPPPRTLEEDRKLKRRANNTLHSRLKRERRRQEEDNMKHELESLYQENLSLKAEQDRLQELLDQADDISSRPERVKSLEGMYTAPAAIALPPLPPRDAEMSSEEPLLARRKGYAPHLKAEEDDEGEESRGRAGPLENNSPCDHGKGGTRHNTLQNPPSRQLQVYQDRQAFVCSGQPQPLETNYSMPISQGPVAQALRRDPGLLQQQQQGWPSQQWPASNLPPLLQSSIPAPTANSQHSAQQYQSFYHHLHRAPGTYRHMPLAHVGLSDLSRGNRNVNDRHSSFLRHQYQQNNDRSSNITATASASAAGVVVGTLATRSQSAAEVIPSVSRLAGTALQASVREQDELLEILLLAQQQRRQSPH